MVVRQGDICWVDMGEPFGSEPGYIRPVIVVQGNVFNASRIGTIICVPLTGNLLSAKAPGNVLLSQRQTGLEKDSVVNVSQPQAFDRSRLSDPVGRIDRRDLDRIFRGLDQVLGR